MKKAICVTRGGCRLIPAVYLIAAPHAALHQRRAAVCLGSA